MTIGRKSLDVQRRTVTRTDANGGKITRELPHWYGRMKVEGKWTWFKLATDKRAAQQQWQAMIRQAEQRDAGVITPQMDAAKKPLSQHVAEYHESLKRTVSDEHYRIASKMLTRFIEAAGWKFLSDINQASTSRVLSEFQAQDKTVAYTNQYLTRVKAFVHWCIPDRLIADPLTKLKRGNLKKALKRRARRPLAEHELAKLLHTCPTDRRLKYAFPAYTGLRRKELADVRWGDLHLESAIPYIQLRAEQTKTGEPATLPLHPYLVEGLNTFMPGMPETKLFPFLPEGRTLLRDLTKAGVKQADEMGRRADFHGLRHTFATRLDASGCSHATSRALMRHGSGDQTDGYTLARLSEMYDAVKRLPYPSQGPEAIAKTGTDDVPTSLDSVDTVWTRAGHGTASTGIDTADGTAPLLIGFGLEGQGFSVDRHEPATSGLIGAGNRDNVGITGPRSSVG